MGTAHVVVGLGIGDEGKGSTIDLLCHATSAKADVRYSAGPQASHHVVRDDGVVHGFAQVGAGSFGVEVKTHLSRGMLIKASNLLVEIDALASRGIEVLDRLTIDPAAALVLPWHAMVSRMAEEVRGTERHGSVGMGVGIAWNERETYPDSVPRMSDLLDRPELARKLSAGYERAQESASHILRTAGENSKALTIHREYTDRFSVRRILDDLESIGGRLAGRLLADEEFYGSVVDRTSSIVLEGTHGVLLDPKYGFAPHITECEVCFEPADAFLERSGHTGSVQRVGVVRAYASRHGAGPLVTFDERLTKDLPERHNGDTHWQGSARAGAFDLVAARYSLACCGGVDFISLTNIDRLREQEQVSICTSYEYQGDEEYALERFFDIQSIAGRSLLVGIKASPRDDKNHRVELTRILRDCRPSTFVRFPSWRYSSIPRSPAALPDGLRSFIEFVESDEGLSVPIGLLSFGPRRSDKLWLVRV